MVHTTNPRESTDDGTPADRESGCPHPSTAYDLLGTDAGNAYHKCQRCGTLAIVPLDALGGEDGDV